MTTDDPRCQAALASLDAMADEWAAETNVAAIAASLADRVDGRAEAIEAMMRQSFVEGAYRLYCKAADDGVIRDALAKDQTVEPSAAPEGMREKLAQILSAWMDAQRREDYPASPHEMADRIRALLRLRK